MMAASRHFRRQVGVNETHETDCTIRSKHRAFSDALQTMGGESLIRYDCDSICRDAWLQNMEKETDKTRIEM